MEEQLLMTLGNHSSSQLQMGPNQKRGPRTLRRDEDPSWDCEDPLQLLEEPPGAHAMLFIIKMIIGIIVRPIPPKPGRCLSRSLGTPILWLSEMAPVFSLNSTYFIMNPMRSSAKNWKNSLEKTTQTRSYSMFAILNSLHEFFS